MGDPGNPAAPVPAADVGADMYNGGACARTVSVPIDTKEIAAISPQRNLQVSVCILLSSRRVVDSISPTRLQPSIPVLFQHVIDSIQIHRDFRTLIGAFQDFHQAMSDASFLSICQGSREIFPPVTDTRVIV